MKIINDFLNIRESAGQRSKSQETEVRFGGLAEPSFSTTWFE